ncbi:hypothetical protein [Bacillus sp. 1P02SD]|uniref:hypothetical protein n=1 Tax=Bacillus sp. 1P02SD TaxID=3132264 RepID=UPI0039A23304
MLRNDNHKDIDLIEDVAYDKLSPDANTAFLRVSFVIPSFKNATGNRNFEE